MSDQRRKTSAYRSVVFSDEPMGCRAGVPFETPSVVNEINAPLLFGAVAPVPACTASPGDCRTGFAPVTHRRSPPRAFGVERRRGCRAMSRFKQEKGGAYDVFVQLLFVENFQRKAPWARIDSAISFL